MVVLLLGTAAADGVPGTRVSVSTGAAPYTVGAAATGAEAGAVAAAAAEALGTTGATYAVGVEVAAAVAEQGVVMTAVVGCWQMEQDSVTTVKP